MFGFLKGTRWDKSLTEKLGVSGNGLMTLDEWRIVVFRAGLLPNNHIHIEDPAEYLKPLLMLPLMLPLILLTLVLWQKWSSVGLGLTCYFEI